MKVLFQITAEKPDPLHVRQIESIQRWIDVHNAVVSREGTIAAILEITERPDEIGESFIWTRLADCYMPLRRFIVNGESSKWQSAENWERNPWFP